MATVRDTARLHPETVTNHAKHARKYKRSSKQSEVKVIKVDPRVWRTAMRLAKGDRSRIVVMGTEEVIVLNPRTK